ncbi:MAG: HAMP domain-containing sensor histidine kinase [Caldisericia bacterium]|nr:HAMP domain-containing sensor histidine kinase [Caldisericia bacterium]
MPLPFEQCPHLTAESSFLSYFDISYAPTLLFYSYIPIFILCIFFGIFIFIKDNFSVLSKYFLGVNLFFAAYIILSLIQWIAVYAEVIHFTWQIYLFFEVGVFLLATFFSYVFLFQKDLSLIYKLILVFFFSAIAIILPTRLNVASFDPVNCEGVSGAIWTVVYIFELLSLVGILSFTLKKIYSDQGRGDWLRTTIFSAGITIFLGIFWISNYFGEATGIYQVNLVGPVGMLIFSGLISYLIVQYKIFNAKLFASQVLVVALFFLVAALLFIRQIQHMRIIVVFTLGLVGFLGINLIRSVKREIEQREKIEKLAVELKKANAELKDLDRQKDELISIVSHQLNTPVTSVKWNLEMMLDGDMGQVNEEQQKQLKTMQSVTNDLSDLVAMMLDVSRIQLGRMKVDRTELDLSEFFRDILLVIDPKAEQKKQKLVKKIPKDLPVAMLDKRLMRMTLENLLTNAVKYTPEGGTVTLNVEAKNGKLRYEVRDTGYGIPKAEQGKIFGKLFRASNIQAQEGNGLGLFAAKGAVEAQGGSIRFESEEKKGTTFYVELPLTAPAREKKE